VQPGAVDLADRCGCDRLGRKLREDIRRAAAAELLAQAGLDVLVRARGNLILKALELLAERIRKFAMMLMSCPTLMNRPRNRRIAASMRCAFLRCLAAVMRSMASGRRKRRATARRRYDIAT